MLKKSEPRHTNIQRGPSTSGEIKTIEDFVRILQSALVDRVTLETKATYLKKRIGTGSQFTVYDDKGISTKLHSGLPPAAIKCVHLQLAREGGRAATRDPQAQRVLSRSLYRELFALTRPSLRDHPNITRLLLYDLIQDKEDENTFVPALIIERADHDLEDVLQWQFSLLEEQDKINICHGVTAGLTALHKAEIIHGDVKAANILVFHFADERRFVAKLSDFGSTILLDEARKPGQHIRYYGTSLTNPPETLAQSGENAIPHDMLVRCDVYSLGLLYLHVVAGGLQAAWTSKSERVLDDAVNFVQQCTALSGGLRAAICGGLKLLLPYHARNRCADLAVVLNLLKPFRLSDIANICLSDTEPTVGRSDANIAENIERVFGLPSALEFGWPEEEDMPKPVQASIIRVLRAQSLGHVVGAGRAHFQMALAYSIGLGVSADVDHALESLLEAAKRGFLPAQAIFYVWHTSHLRPFDIDEETQLDWLYNACIWGSVHATPVLQRKSRLDYKAARKAFHERGGYNQYFYDEQPPAHIGSSEFLEMLKSKAHQPSTKDMAALLQSAAIYGDTPLAQCVLEIGNVDLNMRNRYGESLLVLCCKGGHIDLLHVLVDAGVHANTPAAEKGLPVSESALHWVGAFDKSDQRAAASLLVRAGARVASDIMWNHPIIDLPGKLPLGTPLHYAAYFNSTLLVELLLDPLSKECTANVVNMKGSSMLTPLEFAARYHRYDVVRELIKRGALDDLAENEQVLHEVSTLANYDSWAASGLYNICPDECSRLCALALLERRPSLLEQEDSGYQTPLLTACFYHNRAVVKYLIDCCCDVNTKTPDEYDGRTALNMYSNNQLTYADDDILDLLHEAGANLELGSESGMKPLHFAARDENVRVSKRLLELGVDLDSRSNLGLTPLHSAAQYTATGVGRLLLDSGANPYAQHGRGTFNDKDWRGLTPLAIAASTLQMGFVELLMEDTYNLDPIARPSSADTVIHFAITNGSPEMLQRLLQFPKLRARELIDRKNSKGVTALHLASGNILRHKHIELLIDAGSDINLPTNSGHTVLDILYHTQESVREGLERGRALQQELQFPPEETESVSDDQEIGDVHRRQDTQRPGSKDEEVIDDRNIEKEDTGDEYTSEEEDINGDGLVMEAWYTATNLHLELQDLDETIRSLEQRGGNRRTPTPIPDGMLSLD